MDPYIKNENGTLVPMSIPVSEDSVELENSELVNNSFTENTEGVFVQPKVVGIPVNAYKTHLQTTDGIEITASHIMEEIEILFSFFSNSNVHIFFEGSIYKHDTSIDKIKLLLSAQDESLQFVITDLGITDYTFEQRYRILTTLMENIPVLQHVVLCTTSFVKDIAELKKAHLLNTELGFESSIVKQILLSRSSQNCVSDSR